MRQSKGREDEQLNEGGSVKKYIDKMERNSKANKNGNDPKELKT